jgi:hypothetical protein
MGQIIDFLDDLGLDKTKQKMATLIKTVKVSICYKLVIYNIIAVQIHGALYT